MGDSNPNRSPSFWYSWTKYLSESDFKVSCGSSANPLGNVLFGMLQGEKKGGEVRGGSRQRFVGHIVRFT